MPHRIPLLLSSLFILAFTQAQDDLAALTSQLKALKATTTDTERDSLNALVKAGLLTMLEKEDAMTRTFKDLPMSMVEAPDGAFRLFTWNIPRSNGTHHYEGFMLVQDKRGGTVYELHDATPTISPPEVPELGPDRWYGALYYQVVPVKKGGRTYYTLLGWKGYSKVETRKVIEVLHFKGGRPRFGAPLFGHGRPRATRKVFGFGFQATMMLRHEPTTGRIVLDHLSPRRPDMAGQWAYYGPDLSYDAYVWDKDHWRFERDIDARDPQRDTRPFNTPPKAPKP